MMNNNGLGNLDDLFASALDDGLTDDTLDLVVANLNGPTMVTAVGVPLDQLATNEVTLAMNIIDMSGSMSPHAADLIRAYNDSYLTAMAQSTAVDDILISTILFNDSVSLLHGYVGLPDARRLDSSTYSPYGSTALYDAVAGGLANMVLYTQQLRQSGILVRCIVIVYSDGDDNASKQRAQDVARTSRELLKQELYTLAYVGFFDGPNQQAMGFKTKNKTAPAQAKSQKLADEIGFTEALTAGLNQSELRRIFHMVSTSTVRVSQQSTIPAGIF
ncbi:MAG: VWA domain-containing protein [Chloroflexi bacterium]|nr:VWA domain-containing protein [Chloroflexota bacterium]MBP7044027.1 VWA domain-containing protein [Chloroflexota bacterium]